MTTKSHKYVTLIMFVLITSFMLIPDANAMAGRPYSPGSCDGIKMCTSLEGKEFDMIKFASMGSELIILYDKDKSGEIYPTSMESMYDRDRGTVNDAIFYLSQGLYYDRLIIRKAMKSTGWFKAEELDSVYLLLPRYSVGEVEAPEYSFYEKDGKLRVRIVPVVRSSTYNDD